MRGSVAVRQVFVNKFSLLIAMALNIYLGLELLFLDVFILVLRRIGLVSIPSLCIEMGN